MTSQARNQVEVVRSPAATYFVLLSRREAMLMGLRLLEHFGVENCSLEVKLTGDREIEELNRQFLGLPGPTNVLSFPGRETEEAFLGSMVLSVEAILREAHLYRQPEQSHFLRIMSHGILHLAGHEHGPIMEELTESAVYSLGGS